MSSSSGADTKLDLLYEHIIQGRDLQYKLHKTKEVERGVQNRAKPKVRLQEFGRRILVLFRFNYRLWPAVRVRRGGPVWKLREM